MPVSVNVQTVHPRKLATVRRGVPQGAVGAAWGPALDKVWKFIRSQPGLRSDGHNIFLYHHPTEPGAGLTLQSPRHKWQREPRLMSHPMKPKKSRNEAKPFKI
jgi:hypothetical protein